MQNGDNVNPAHGPSNTDSFEEHESIVSFQAFRKGAQIRKTRSVALFEPPIQLISLPLSHHAKEPLGQGVSCLDIRLLANEGQHLLLFCGQLLWFPEQEKGAGVEETLTDQSPYAVPQSAMGSQDLLVPAEESFFVLLERHQRRLGAWRLLVPKNDVQACPGTLSPTC